MLKVDRRFIAQACFVVWCSLLAALTYGAVLRLPFFLDDLIQIPFLDKHTLPALWQTADELAFYRPLGFSLWKVMYLIIGHHSAFAQYALNLVLFIANAWLVGWLVDHLRPAPETSPRAIDWRRRYLGATLFLLYPFNYQALAIVSALVHHLVLALILASLVSYLKLRETGRRRWGVLGLALAALGPFAHENGVLIGPLIACVELCLPARSESLRQRLARCAVWFLPVLFWLPVWRSIPKGFNGGGLSLNNAETIFQNGAYFLQGAAYPVSWLSGELYATYGVNDLVAALGVSGLALIGAALIQPRGDRRAWLPWLWCLVGGALVIFFLRARYVISSPRLLMLSSVGAVWLWVNVIVSVIDRGRLPVTRRRLTAATAALCAVLLFQNYQFIRARLDLYTMGGAAIDQVVAATREANAAGQTAAFINLPTWLAPTRPVYALGHEGADLLLGDPPIENLAGVNSGRPADLIAARYDAVRLEMPYYYGVRGEAPDWPALTAKPTRVFIADYRPDAIELQPAGALAPVAAATRPVAIFDQAVALLDAHAVSTSHRLTVNLTWQTLAPLPPEVTVFVHILDAGGRLLAQKDGDALAGVYAFAVWPNGLTAQDTRLIELEDQPAVVQVGLYNRATGDRLVAVSNAGATWPDNAVPIPTLID